VSGCVVRLPEPQKMATNGIKNIMNEYRLRARGRFSGNKKHYVLSLLVILLVFCIFNFLTGPHDWHHGATTIALLLAVIFEFLVNYYLPIGWISKFAKGFGLACLLLGSFYVFGDLFHRWVA
jgi:hypothetical protein